MVSKELSKEQRQKRIQDIIARESISTQGELVQRLRADNIQVTQATISRDINELRLVRLPIGKGRHRYALAQMTGHTDVEEELGRLFQNFVHDVDRGENMLVIRTADGHATGVALLLDRLRRDDIVGTLAGEDTIFVVARTTLEAESLMEEFHALMLG
ncbi:arginine repressor [Deinococcus deserti]|uniref:Arginine repressor n=1 Tax=Deinococcus deserti (strain DSM 17065 / CIP 109153 / LMG 22923 / VCD115) TaxID=546414 RepID=ARGR_DEIDV|nr:arginine repressor [Deinococcus deserti]C1CYD7.1 RecName: Full=Arginine repressor [Deinococcus deserti VCD115]ACO44958.1 putative Arginine repressor [Deinococcus deserti VCD115]